MRIGLVISAFDPRRGGAEGWTCDFAKTLAAWGHEVHVAAREFAAGNETPRPLSPTQASSLVLPTIPPSLAPRPEVLPMVFHRLSSCHSRLAFAAAAEAALKPLALDVVHDMGAGWYGQVLTSHDGSRLALWERKLVLLPRWVRPLKRLLFRLLPRYREFRQLMARQFADPRRIFVAISRLVAQDLERYQGVRREQIRLVYPGIDLQRFSSQRACMLRAASRERFALDDDETVFLFVGHDFVRKGLATAIRALGRLASENLPVRLLVAGKGHGWRRCARLARRYGVGGRVQFLGTIDDPLPAYAAADALLLPSYHEPFGLVALEAAACGLPVLLSRMVGASELVTDGCEGFVLAEPDDDAAWAARMYSLLDYRQAARMGAAARGLALQHPWERSCEELLAVYHEVCGEAAQNKTIWNEAVQNETVHKCSRTQAPPRAA